jgi:hypothetical protein
MGEVALFSWLMVQRMTCVLSLKPWWWWVPSAPKFPVPLRRRQGARAQGSATTVPIAQPRRRPHRSPASATRTSTADPIQPTVGSNHPGTGWTLSWRTTRPTPTPTAASRRPSSSASPSFRLPRPCSLHRPSTSSNLPTS